MWLRHCLTPASTSRSGHLLIETDDSGQSITQVAQAIAPTLSLDINDLLALAATNLQRFLADKH